MTGNPPVDDELARFLLLLLASAGLPFARARLEDGAGRTRFALHDVEGGGASHLLDVVGLCPGSTAAGKVIWLALATGGRPRTDNPYKPGHVGC